MPSDSSKPTTDRTDIVTSLLTAVLPVSLHRVIRFGLAGLAATLVYFLLTNALVLAGGMPPVPASVVAYLLSLGVSYLLQSRFTFQVNANSLNQVARFVITSMAGLALAWCVMAISVDVLSWPYVVGAAAICLLIPIVNFFVFRGWVFAMRRDEENLPPREP